MHNASIWSVALLSNKFRVYRMQAAQLGDLTSAVERSYRNSRCDGWGCVRRMVVGHIIGKFRQALDVQDGQNLAEPKRMDEMIAPRVATSASPGRDWRQV